MKRALPLIASALLSAFIFSGLAAADTSALLMQSPLLQSEAEPQASRCYGMKPMCSGSPEPCCVCPRGASECTWTCCRER